MWSRCLRLLRRYSDFDGRTGAGGFAMFWLFQRLAVAAANLAGGALGLKLSNPHDLTLFAVLSLVPVPFTLPGLLVLLALFIPGLAIAVRRLHDRELDGAWLLLPIMLGGGLGAVAFLMASFGAFMGREADSDSINLFLAMCAAIPAGASLITLFIIGGLPGSTGSNRYGPVPGRQTA